MHCQICILEFTAEFKINTEILTRLSYKIYPIHGAIVFTILFHSAEKVYFRGERSAGVFQHGARYCPDHYNVHSATRALQ